MSCVSISARIGNGCFGILNNFSHQDSHNNKKKKKITGKSQSKRKVVFECKETEKFVS